MMLYNLVDKIISRSAFPRVYSVDAELKKAGIARIILGVVLLVRISEIVITKTIYDGVFTPFYGLMLFLLVLFTFGFATPVVTFLLLLLARAFDLYCRTYTLGTIILVQLLLVLVLINHGEKYSIDGLLLKGKGFMSSFIKWMYGIIGPNSKQGIERAYFLVFFMYAIISFGALSIHLQDDFWVGGLTVKSLLSNTYLCKYALTFRNIENSYPVAVSLFSISGSIFQSVFQFLMLPLIFTRYGMKFVIYWGLTFFLISLFFINLSYLPYIEILIWWLIFFPAGKSKQAISNRVQNKVAGYNGKLRKAIYTVYFALTILFVFYEYPYIGSKMKRYTLPAEHHRTVQELLAKAGLELPVVFNKEDLRMGDNWMCIYRMKGDELDIVPFTDEIGKRMSYIDHDILNFTNHNSDVFYFNWTVVFRRMISMSEDKIEFMETGYGREQAMRRIKFDYIFKKSEGEKTYLVRLYKNHSSKVTHWKADKERHDPTLFYETTISYDGDDFH